MPNKQKHRGQNTKDSTIFNEQWIIKLREAVNDLCFLLSKEYSQKASLKLVGDRYRLSERQRKAVMRASCSEASKIKRQNNCINEAQLNEKTVLIDGYNLLITIETALSKGILLRCKDNCYRDIASVHSTYRKVEETQDAILMIGETLKELKVGKIIWYFDAPVSNSGKLKKLMLEIALSNQWNWEIELVNSPDKKIVEDKEIAISSDGWILENVENWFNMNSYIISKNFVNDKNIKNLK